MKKKSRSAKAPSASMKDLRPRATKEKTAKGVRGGFTSTEHSSLSTGKVSVGEFQISKVVDKSTAL